MYSTASCLPRCSQCRGSDEFHHASAYDNLAHARAAIGEFIETIYNRQRLHSALGDLSPVEFEISQPWAAAQQPMASTVASNP